MSNTGAREDKQFLPPTRYIIFSHLLTTSMVSWLASSSVDRGFEPESDQIKDYKIAICFFAKHAELSDLSTVDYGFSDRGMVYNTTFNNLSVIS